MRLLGQVLPMLTAPFQNSVEEAATQKFAEQLDQMGKDGTMSLFVSKVITGALITKKIATLKWAGKIAGGAATAGTVAGGTAQAAQSMPEIPSPLELVPDLEKTCEEQGYAGLLAEACISAATMVENAKEQVEAAGEVPIDEDELEAAAQQITAKLLGQTSPMWGRNYWRKRYADVRPAEAEGDAEQQGGG